jgi:hypothetical protein
MGKPYKFDLRIHWIMMVSEQESPAVGKLPQWAEYRIVSVYRQYLRDETIAPGHHGKRGFVDKALENSGLLPQDLQSEVDSRRGGIGQRGFLLAHDGILDLLSPYLDHTGDEMEAIDL